MWLISGTVYLMLLSWNLLLIHLKKTLLKTDLIGSRVIKMLNMITLLNWPEPEADQSFIWNKISKLLYIKFDYYDTGIEAVYSLRPWNIIDLTGLDHSHQSATPISDSLMWLKSSNPYADLNLHPKPNANSNTKFKLSGHTTWRNGKSSVKHFLTNMLAAMTVCFN